MYVVINTVDGRMKNRKRNPYPSRSSQHPPTLHKKAGSTMTTTQTTAKTTVRLNVAFEYGKATCMSCSNEQEVPCGIENLTFLRCQECGENGWDVDGQFSDYVLALNLPDGCELGESHEELCDFWIEVEFSSAATLAAWLKDHAEITTTIGEALALAVGCANEMTVADDFDISAVIKECREGLAWIGRDEDGWWFWL